MVVDGGKAGLDQSRHHPNAGQSAFAAPSERLSANPTDLSGAVMKVIQLLQKISSLVPVECPEVREAREACEEATRCLSEFDAPTPIPRPQADETPITETTLRKILAETLKAPSPAVAAASSWAKVAALPTPLGRGAAGPQEIRTIVPERRARELVIRAPVDSKVAKGKPQDIVAAVNKELGSGEAVAARRLPSGDTVLTFEKNSAQYTHSDTWVKSVFGETATLYRREVAVMAKGLHADRLRAVGSDATLAKALQGRYPAISRCKRVMPRNKEGRFAALVLHISSVDAAKALCTDGLIWEAQIFDCEPYCSELQIRQCYKCYGYGHLARYCTKTARCGHCAAAAHAGGEQACPERNGSGKKRCVNCSGRHVAWDRSCPAAQEQRERVKEAYQFRPRQFEERSSASSGSSSVGASLPSRALIDDDGFTVVGAQPRKRRAAAAPSAGRGRPRLARPGDRSNGDIRASLSRAPLQRSTTAPPEAEAPGTQETPSSVSQW